MNEHFSDQVSYPGIVYFFLNMILTKTAPRLPVFLRIANIAKRSLSGKPDEVFTSLNNASDPARNQFFQYTWGSWLKNNKVERARRETRFSIEAISSLVKTFKIEDGALQKPQTTADGITSLKHNWNKDVIGESNYEIKSIASIHEGKHHRVYRITLGNGKNLALRIPYKLDSDFAIEQSIKSEAATLDFLNLKLGLNVPKVVAFGATKTNALQVPFMLMEHIEGELLMRKWDPMVPSSETADKALKEVIDPVMDFQAEALEMTFNKFGSLFFFDDVAHEHQLTLPYDGETNESLKNRWRIGPSVERAFSRGKKHLSAQDVGKFNGPWNSTKPLDLVSDLAKIQLEALRQRLALVQADAGSRLESADELNKQISTFEHLLKISQTLFNPESQSIMNAVEMFKPRMFFPDLDPLNVIVQKDTGKQYFIDFEHTCIKPFIFFNYPAFVAYQGAKIYNLEEDIPGYAEMDDVEKQQYQFMFYKTRNERLWEYALNDKRHDLIAIASPHAKVLKAPYLQALECKTDKDYLFVENSIVQLQAMWNVYVANGLVNTQESAFPISYTQEQLDQHQQELENYQMEIVSQPFAATGGWIPQDMFDVLQLQGIIVDDGDGNYHIENEAVLKDMPPTQAEESK